MTDTDKLKAEEIKQKIREVNTLIKDLPDDMQVHLEAVNYTEVGRTTSSIITFTITKTTYY